MRSDIEAQSDSQILASGFDHWRSLRTGDDVPNYSRFNPMKIGALLPHVILMKVQTRPLDFQYRLIGETVLRNMSTDYTGQWISEIPLKASPSILFDSLSTCVMHRTPVSADTPYVGPHKDFLNNQELILPFTEDGGDIGRLLIFLDFVPKTTLLD